MKSIVLVLLVLCGSPTRFCAQTKATTGPRPQTNKNERMSLPEKIVAARTVFLINETEENKFGDKFYQELKKWDRWQIVTDRAKADLVLIVSQRDSLGPVVTTGTATATGQTSNGTVVSGQLKSSDWHLYVVDATSGETLWRTKTTGQGKMWRMWSSIAKSLLSDIQMRLK
jgi:outer membrane protein assembly factor BamB